MLFARSNSPAPAMPETAVPEHIAIIMDGNGRWARNHNLPRAMGHRKGAEALRKLLTPCIEKGLKYLTLYAFSTENWNRPVQEVSELMGLLQYYIEHELAFLHQHRIRLRVIGDLNLCNKTLIHKITEAVHQTSEYTHLNLTIALSYGSRQEITQAMRDIASQIATGTLLPESIDESCIASSLYTADLPDPDLLIRTGGEYRLSNFLLWQAAYTELYFTPTLWPDFTAEDLTQALENYAGRERRFGNV